MTDNQASIMCEPATACLTVQPNLPRHILVVEDDSSLRELNTEALLQSGYAVDNVADGAAAWQALNTNSYDLMITDNNMPKLSGVELLKKMQAAQMVLPVIMATGTVPHEEFTRQAWLQPSALLMKPYTIEALLQMAKKVLSEAARATASSRPFNDRDTKDRKTLPVEEQAEAGRPGAQRILAVDHDSDLRRLYAEALADDSCHVDVAADGAAAWAALQTKQYDLLLTEHDLPSFTGVELVRKMRAAHMALPVIMAAGRLPIHELARNPVLQLAATLEKPFEVHVLRDTVRNVLRATARTVSSSESINAQSQSVAVGLRFR